MTTAAPAPAKLASTVLLLRDGAEGLEVFMVVRHQEIDFASGALVFPGGKVAKGDSEPEALAHCSGLDGLAPEAAALRVAAIREAFEECGVLFARERGSKQLIGAERLAGLEHYRQPLDRGELGIGQMLREQQLELACEALVPFAHWITPVMMPKRFDTLFFLAVAPAEHLAVHDGHELVDSVWIRPADALREADVGRRTVIAPTRMNIQRLGFSDSVAEALAAAQAQPVIKVLPELVQTPAGPRLRIPLEAGYRVSEFVPGSAPAKAGSGR
jgi:8-oxo-dGTP pyrophosphatase MutT (NUDIX family)